MKHTQELYILQERNCPCGNPFRLEVFERVSHEWIAPKLPNKYKVMTGLICTSCMNHVVLMETPLESYLKYHHCKRIEVPQVTSA